MKLIIVRYKVYVNHGCSLQGKFAKLWLNIAFIVFVAASYFTSFLSLELLIKCSMVLSILLGIAHKSFIFDCGRNSQQCCKNITWWMISKKLGMIIFFLYKIDLMMILIVIIYCFNFFNSMWKRFRQAEQKSICQIQDCRSWYQSEL